MRLDEVIPIPRIGPPFRWAEGMMILLVKELSDAGLSASMPILTSSFTGYRTHNPPNRAFQLRIIGRYSHELVEPHTLILTFQACFHLTHWPL
jgi:hypothetical protein